VRPGRDGEAGCVHSPAMEGRAAGGSTTPGGVAVLLPVKAFHAAKARLAPSLDAAARSSLAREMAERVLDAAGPLPVAVVCDDHEVAEWAHQCAAEVLWRPGRGLNGAVEDGVGWLAAHGFERVVVAHADLPWARDLQPVADFDGATLVPDRHGDGTNVVCVPACGGFRFAYGAGSFRRHVAEVERLGLALRVLHDDRLGWDVDLPDDLAAPAWLSLSESPLQGA
jgi:2-phospho-L-lactate/phosphoenolpyruvate guanylyltransferase